MSLGKIGQLPLEWVRVFEAAGRTGSFTAAAAEIGLTQAAVSQRIKNLEQLVGVSLFSRQPRGVILTVDGEAWLPYVTQALLALNRSADELFGKAPDRITLSASASVAQMWIIPRLAALENRPRFQISLTTMTIEPDFAKANATLEIRYIRHPRPEGLATRLYREALVPLAAPALLEAGTPWWKLPRIAVSGPRPGWQEWTVQSGDAVTAVPNYRFDSYVSAHAAAKAGLGVILGSMPLSSQDLASGSLVRLSDKSLTPDAGYWMTASEDILARRHWVELVKILCEPDEQT
ncbi:LysR family transcriptional regulator [Hoeflea sp. YIM 152468]|uniref:LysR family transcriptional regulator n=1 Tax=Hoeflea sp. YIM 152468 TaxID=3031759 RepID=UPI0023DAA104|nr:LysR family transcriptional regulator [Hoeflea sp. YIM 152468]MDF1609444.1 LysR family transcriptional regulator [Hoeflea sp. YIM 152468]